MHPLLSFSAMSEPHDSFTWLSTLNPPLDRYAGVLSRHGFETTFALGLIDADDDLQELGLWKDDVARIVGALGGPRRLVASWTPFISKLPVRNLSLSQFFLISPVPNLASHVPVLTAEGFGHIACFKSISESDFGVMPSIPWGHKLTMLRLAMAMSSDCYAPPANIEVDLTTWLGHLSPPMHMYVGCIQLLPGSPSTVLQLFRCTREALFKLPMPLGVLRALWHYIVKERLHWVDVVN